MPRALRGDATRATYRLAIRARSIISGALCGSSVAARRISLAGRPPSAMTAELHITHTRTFDDLVGLRPQWSRLVEYAENSSTFLTPEWLLSWWQAYQPPAELHVLAAYESDSLVGIAPMMIRRERRVGLPVRCLRFIGDGSSETDHMDFIVHAAHGGTVRVMLLNALADLPWDLAVFSNIPERSDTLPQLRAWCDRRRLSHEESAAPCPVRNLPESYETLLAAMPSRFRTSLRSTRRRLAAAHRVEFGLHDDPAAFPDALDALYSNHESRWRAKGKSGVFVDPRRRNFYATLTTQLHAAGALRFFFLRLDDRIVAQEYCFSHNGDVYLLQEGFDFNFVKENVGNVLRSYVFEYLISNGYRAYDFLAGVSRHKLNWSDATVHDVTVCAARSSPRGWLGFQGPRAVESLKSRLRPLRDRLRKPRRADTETVPAEKPA